MLSPHSVNRGEADYTSQKKWKWHSGGRITASVSVIYLLIALGKPELDCSQDLPEVLHGLS